jgi:hypothetical protein
MADFPVSLFYLLGFTDTKLYLHDMLTKQLYRYVAIIALISLGMSILLHFDSILDLFAPNRTSFHGNSGDYGYGSVSNILAEVFVTTMVAFCTFILNYYIIRPLDGLKKIGLKRKLLAIIITIISVYLLSELFFDLKRMFSGVYNPNKFVLLYFFRDMFMAIVVLICVFIIKVFYERQTILLENEKLMRENLQSQYQSLKNQVSPHFLFNSLTALKELIDDDPANARLYVSHLSQILRYTLQSNENQTVSLSDEIESVRSYIFLIKMRFGTNLTIEFNVSDSYKNHRLPPLVIQTLIENSVKHNEISKRYPLNVLILTSVNESLVVSNTIRKKLSLEPGTGIGLANLTKQYELLCGKEIHISKSDNEFRVEVPLLKPNGDESHNS